MIHNKHPHNHPEMEQLQRVSADGSEQLPETPASSLSPGCMKAHAVPSVPPPIDFSPNERADYPHGSDFLQEFESVI